MSRQSLSSGGTVDRGQLVTPDQLKQLFITDLTEGAYLWENNGSEALQQTINVNTSTLFGKWINITLTKQKQVPVGQPAESYTMGSKNDRTQFLTFKLPAKSFGTAVKDMKEYEERDSVGKAAYADQVFGDRKKIALAGAKTNKALGNIKKLLSNFAMSKGLIQQAWDEIPWENAEVQAYWTSELAPRFTEATNTLSLFALTQPGQVFENCKIYAKNDSYNRLQYTLYEN